MKHDDTRIDVIIKLEQWVRGTEQDGVERPENPNFFDYESEGRTFESFRAHQYFKDLGWKTVSAELAETVFETVLAGEQIG